MLELGKYADAIIYFKFNIKYLAYIYLNKYPVNVISIDALQLPNYIYF